MQVSTNALSMTACMRHLSLHYYDIFENKIGEMDLKNIVLAL